jgi:hypothetical protein
MYTNWQPIFYRLSVGEAEVNPKIEDHGESSSIFQLIGQLENIADKLLAG